MMQSVSPMIFALMESRGIVRRILFSNPRSPRSFRRGRKPASLARPMSWSILSSVISDKSL